MAGLLKRLSFLSPLWFGMIFGGVLNNGILGVGGQGIRLVSSPSPTRAATCVTLGRLLFRFRASRCVVKVGGTPMR